MASRGGRRAGSLKGGRSTTGSKGGTAAKMHSNTGGIGKHTSRSGGHGGGGTYHGFKSKKQWRWAWASGQPWARKKSHETAGGPKIRYRRLPESKHSGKKGSRVPSSV
jgi:hypothetical protein